MDRGGRHRQGEGQRAAEDARQSVGGEGEGEGQAARAGGAAQLPGQREGEQQGTGGQDRRPG